MKDEELDVEQLDDGPTLEEVRSWPATVSVARAATAFGISRSKAYELVAQGEFPARVIAAGASRRVITASLVNVLSC
ncbi:DNA-binding protein [Lentzea sp. NPDC092896]|uniref:DNA-binding protein n=1 Tax=Lentzea sp. NPDC092896 TaxID=3364127 RepID=UPI0037F4C439